MKKHFQYFSSDLPASIVVFLISIPLCLGIALGSGAPLFAGITAGIIGAIITGMLSGSQLSVSGPAAGLSVIVAASITQLASYETFLMAVVIAGIIQIAFGYLKAGLIGDFIPNSVLKGMISAIGCILMLKQFPHLVGFDDDFVGDETFLQLDSFNSISEINHALKFIHPAALFIGFISLLILFIMDRKLFKKHRILHFFPGALIAVLVSILLNEFLLNQYPHLAITNNHLVNLPLASTPKEFLNLFHYPDFSSILNSQVWTIALILAVIASLESLVSIEAADKLDPLRRFSEPNRELFAQGISNIMAGLMGGLPVTSVVVRTSVNVNAGAKSKLSSIISGIFILLSVLLIPNLLNKIPLSALAAILFYAGYQLVSIALIREFFKKGWDQFIPFMVTIVVILFTSLLGGLIAGIVVGIFYMVRSNFRSAILTVNNNHHYLIRFKKDVSFLNKPLLKKRFEEIPKNAVLLLDVSRATFIDKDIIEEINDFFCHAHLKNIKVELRSGNNELHQLINQDLLKQ